MQRELAAAEAALGRAQRQADERVAAAVERLRGGDIAATPSRHRSILAFLSPTPRGHTPRGSSTPAAPATALVPHVRQALAVNHVVLAEIRQADGEIRLLQHAV